MKELTAVDLRRSLETLADALEEDGEPTLLELGRRPVGVIVSLTDFRRRFALKDAAREREAVLDEILSDRVPGAEPVDAALAATRRR